MTIMTSKTVEPVTRCCRCGSAESVAWFPLRRHGVTVCQSCYSECIRAGAHAGPFVPV